LNLLYVILIIKSEIFVPICAFHIYAVVYKVFCHPPFLLIGLHSNGCMCKFLKDLSILKWSFWLNRRSQWLLSLRRRSEAAWLLGLHIQTPVGAWMFVSCVYMLLLLSCVGRGLCNGLITRPEESFRVSLYVCDQETPKGRPKVCPGL
jgi:hypothetical protein